MRRHYRPDPDREIEERRSIAVWGELADRKAARLRRPLRRVETFYGSMLYQDVQSSVLPYRIGENPDFGVRLDPDPGKAHRDQIVEGLGQDSWRGLDDAVDRWLREASGALALCGRVAYEIVYLVEVDTSERVGFQLHLVPPGLYYRRWGRDLQYVPRRDGERRGRAVRLPADRLILAEFPAGRRREMQRALAALDVASDFSSASTDLAVAAMNQGLAYDFSVHRQMHEVAVARASKTFGWDARRTVEERMLEPYRVWGYLQQERFKIELRSVLLDGLNRGLGKVGARLGWSSRVVIDGLPTERDVQQAEDDLVHGSCGVDEILQRFHPWLKLTSESHEGAGPQGDVSE